MAKDQKIPEETVQYGSSLLGNLESVLMANKTKNKTQELLTQKKPPKEKVEEVYDIIDDDEFLDVDVKKLLLKEIIEKYQHVLEYRFDNCPDNYQALKKEANLLAQFMVDVQNSAYLILGQRLLKIKNERLYIEDNYTNFRDFLKYEIKIGKSAAYNFMNIINVFGVQALGHYGIDESSKLIPWLPLFNNRYKNIPQQKLKEVIFEGIKNKSFREMEEEAQEYKKKYGLINNQKSKKVDVKKEAEKFLSKLPEKIDESQQKDIGKLLKQLCQYIDQEKSNTPHNKEGLFKEGTIKVNVTEVSYLIECLLFMQNIADDSRASFTGADDLLKKLKGFITDLEE